ncbi:hypothetical protein [Methanococcus maripaludis]|uniref:PEGA domain-containing protein n=2 Tax=Methanococcus maripaludis TaxID=39152 RepID=A0A7J9PJC8_METMI|nr:hypothetical protein [Methanococcus maripaludis]MBA2861629.1 hypothetical protein [Methanococcus maripaludis]
MKKHFLLFLLVLLCVSTVNAGTTTISSSDQTSDYYVVLNNPYTDELLLSALNTTSWSHYIPVVIGYGDNKVYFSSEKDLARFCTVLAYNNKVLPFSGEYVAYIGDQPATVTTYYSTSTTTRTGYVENAQYAYIYAVAYTGGDYYGSESCIYFNSESLAHAEGKNAASGQFTSRAVSGTYDHRVACLGYQGYGFYSVTIFDYVDYDDTLVTTLIEPPEKYEITLVSNVNDFDVYEGTVKIGTYNSADVIKMVPGNYELTFVKEGYWNETKTVEVTEEGATVSLEMFPEDELYLISSNVTTENIVTNMEVEMTLHIEPMIESQNTMISFSKDIVSIKEGTESLTKDGDDYIIGNFYEPIDLTVTFNSGTLTGNRYIETTVFGTAYVGTQSTDFLTTKSIDYTVNSLPIVVYMPDWEEGVNELRITEQEGNTLILNVEVLDSSDDSVYAQNVVFNPYGVETLDINLTEGIYYLHLYCTDFDTNIAFSVSESSDDSDIIAVVVTSDDSIIDTVSDTLTDYWYVPVGLGIIIGIYYVFSKKKGKKPSKLTKGGKNGKK